MDKLLRDRLYENSVIQSRLVLLAGLSLLLAAILLTRLFILQYIDYDLYTQKADSNRVDHRAVPPVRGVIFDRNGELLATNQRAYDIELQPNLIDNLEKTLTQLQLIAALDESQMTKLRKRIKSRPGFERIAFKTNVDEDIAAAFSSRQHQLPGVFLEAHLQRHYPHAETTGHVVGYVGRINTKDLQRIDKSVYRGTQYIGKRGIEQSYESRLLGVAGKEDVETNAHGRRVRSLNRTVPTTGDSLYLSIDLELQRKAKSLLKGREGAIVALNPKNGEILAFVSEPGYDPNPFVNGISSKAYSALRDSERRPLLNRALNGRYAPGSTIKMFMGLLGIQNGITPSETVYCPGYFKLPNSRHRYRCWKHSGHGTMNLDSSITQSCDVYFYSLAHRLGIDRLFDGMTKFGFGQKTGIDIPNEPSALMPSRDWKKRTRGKSWYPGETVITGIGQGFMLVTPIQLATSIATLANRGIPVTPHFVTNVQHPETGEVHDTQPAPLPKVEGYRQQDYQEVINAMTNVMHGSRGTARRHAKDLNYKMAGKTGTAQVKSIAQNARYDKNTDKKFRDHSLYVGFAPVDDPQIAIAVIIEHGGSGSAVAAPMGVEVMDYYLVDRLKMFERKEVADASNN